MIKSLNMDVLCEGVETLEYAEFLKTVGCTIIQGYLYDKPLPEDDFRKKYIK
jgi:EAL domain-containing protein (putative c-di-GMP-specific phosphodiesterase class I)